MAKGFRKIRKRVRRGPKRAKVSFPSRVLQVLNRQRELKCGVPLVGNIADVRPDITALTRTTNTLPIMATIAQGTGENQRIGNQITLKKIVIRGYYKMTLPSGSALASRYLIRNMIVRQRNINDAATITTGTISAAYGLILEPSNGYLGSVSDYMTPVNKDAFVVRKEYKRSISSDFIPAPATNAEGLADSYVFFNYTMTFGKGKNLRYRTDVATTSEDFSHFMMHSATTIGSGVIPPAGAITFNYVATPYFYDV